MQLQVEQYESRCDTYLNLVGWLVGQSDPMPPEKQASLCLHLADLIRARSVRSVMLYVPCIIPQGNWSLYLLFAVSYERIFACTPKNACLRNATAFDPIACLLKNRTALIKST